MSCFKEYLSEFPNRAVSPKYFRVDETEHREVNSLPKVVLLAISRDRGQMHGLRTLKLAHGCTLDYLSPSTILIYPK